MAASIQGRFLWYQLNCHDVEAHQPFYKSLIGWGVEVLPPPPGMDPYPMWTRDGMPIGGIMKMPPEVVAAGAPPHWLAYIGADDVDASHARALEMGAQSCLPPVDIPGAGRLSVLMDPQGGLFALYKPELEVPPPTAPQVGDIAWHELGTTDLEGAWKFYSTLFGWQIEQDMDMGELGIYRIYRGEGPPLGGIYVKPPEMPVVAWMLYATIEDCRLAVDQVKALGGQVFMGPHEVPGGGTILMIADDQGAAFALFSSGPSAPGPSA